ncbi:Ig lambda chain V-II region NIG-84 [Tupaia chinensis]|uniref:Ig lambda chain V-II region NIG-84 n=1 Tax=Tupaia chinensis TaxID=246437 RepID=L9LBY8_TUPCH|nr:Ig lambda chain V-II region NIG-84 [Tupaia chinensis]
MPPNLLIYKDTIRFLEVSDRFSGSKSGNTASLTITDLRPEDEASYHCKSAHTTVDICTVLRACGEVRQEPLLHLPEGGGNVPSNSCSGLACGFCCSDWWPRCILSHPGA